MAQAVAWLSEASDEALELELLGQAGQARAGHELDGEGDDHLS